MSQVESIITQAWQRQAWWLWLFLPLSTVYAAVIRIRKFMYNQGWLYSYRPPVPIMVIGNITIGGSGKTPLIITLVDYLQNKGVKVGVISRGYGGDTKQMPSLVTQDSIPQIVGDEPCLIVSTTGVPMSVCPERKRAIECLLQAHPDLALIISDDGLQHYALQRDIEWIVVDSERGFGNGQLLPTGYLREPIKRLAHSTVIHHHTQDVDVQNASYSDSTHTLTMTLMPDNLVPLCPNHTDANLTQNRWNNKGVPAEQFRRNYPKVYAVSGIGYPTRFFKTLRHLGFDVVERPFADHHPFSKHDFENIYEANDSQHDIPIVVTTKDAVKLRQLLKQHSDMLSLPIWVLPVHAMLAQDCYQLLDKQLKDLQII